MPADSTTDGRWEEPPPPGGEKVVGMGRSANVWSDWWSMSRLVERRAPADGRQGEERRRAGARQDQCKPVDKSAHVSSHGALRHSLHLLADCEPPEAAPQNAARLESTCECTVGPLPANEQSNHTSALTAVRV